MRCLQKSMAMSRLEELEQELCEIGLIKKISRYTKAIQSIKEEE